IVLSSGFIVLFSIFFPAEVYNPSILKSTLPLCFLASGSTLKLIMVSYVRGEVFLSCFFISLSISSWEILQIQDLFQHFVYHKIG
ncbi:unnamed protein product, partial [marine sediment metagenome]